MISLKPPVLYFRCELLQISQEEVLQTQVTVVYSNFLEARVGKKKFCFLSQVSQEEVLQELLPTLQEALLWLILKTIKATCYKAKRLLEINGLQQERLSVTSSLYFLCDNSRTYEQGRVEVTHHNVALRQKYMTYRMIRINNCGRFDLVSVDIIVKALAWVHH